MSPAPWIELARQVDLAVSAGGLSRLIEKLQNSTLNVISLIVQQLSATETNLSYSSVLVLYDEFSDCELDTLANALNDLKCDGNAICTIVHNCSSSTKNKLYRTLSPRSFVQPAITPRDVENSVESISSDNIVSYDPSRIERPLYEAAPMDFLQVFVERPVLFILRQDVPSRPTFFALPPALRERPLSGNVDLDDNDNNVARRLFG